jgi:acetyl esterase/lipase
MWPAIRPVTAFDPAGASMTRSAAASIAIVFLSVTALARQAAPQTVDPATRFVQVANTYSLAADITYLRAGGADLKLDVYRPSNATGPTPVLMFMHGGGWTNGSKNSSLFAFLPFLEMGWAVVNVEYRLADVALAPAAVEDCRCALRWIYQNAKQYKFDLENIVTTGQSAGGHLALTTAMIPESAGLDRQCPGDRRRAWTTGDLGTQEMKVAAVLDFYGITDVEDLMNRKPGTSGNFTEAWLGSAIDRAAIAKRVSPATYVRKGLPPIMIIHGNADPIVPFDQATKLKKMLDAAGTANEFYTVEGGGHGGWTTADMEKIYKAVGVFFAKYHIGEPHRDGTRSRP